MTAAARSSSPAVGDLERPPGRPGLNRGFGIGAPTAVAAALRPEAGQFPALDVVDQDGIRASHVLRGPPGRADQCAGFFELAHKECGGGAAGLRVPSRGGVTQLLGFPAEEVQLSVGGGVAELEQGSGAQQPGLGGQVGAVQLAGEGEQLIENGQALAGRPRAPADIVGGDQAMGERPQVAGPAGQADGVLSQLPRPGGSGSVERVMQVPGEGRIDKSRQVGRQAAGSGSLLEQSDGLFPFGRRPGLGPDSVEPEGGPGQPWIVGPSAGQGGAVEVGGPGQRQPSRLPPRLAQFEQDIKPGRGVGVEQGKDALEVADGIGERQAGGGRRGGRPAVADGRGPHRRVGSGEGDGAVMGGKLGRVG